MIRVLAGVLPTPRMRFVLPPAVLAALALAAPAAADTLQGRDTPFTAAQAAADQYTTPTPQTPLVGPATTTTPPAVAGDVTEGGPSGEGPAVAGDTIPGEGEAGAQAEAGGTAGATDSGPATSGTLPFTGADLLALVWIALALVALGTAIEVVRRRLDAA